MKSALQPVRLLFAGLVTEYMKGFHVLHAACERLWRKRHDFELVATADPMNQIIATIGEKSLGTASNIRAFVEGLP